VRVDGQPFADTIGSLLASSQMYWPLILDEHGAVPSPSIPFVWSGTLSDGGLTQNCVDFQFRDAGLNGEAGSLGAVTPAWSASSPLACSYALPLYCFGIDQQTPVSPLAPTPSRLAFLSVSSYVLDGGIGQADGDCAAEASAAGLSGNFLALLSTDGGSAWSRFGASGGAWVRLDGAALKPTAAALLAVDGGGLDVALNLDRAGVYQVSGNNGAVWSGSVTPAEASTGTNNCANWTSTTLFASGTGVPAALNGTWWDFAALGSSCGTPHHLYCLQQ
jgi:hypothetical protein